MCLFCKISLDVTLVSPLIRCFFRFQRDIACRRERHLVLGFEWVTLRPSLVVLPTTTDEGRMTHGRFPQVHRGPYDQGVRGVASKFSFRRDFLVWNLGSVFLKGVYSKVLVPKYYFFVFNFCNLCYPYSVVFVSLFSCLFTILDLPFLIFTTLLSNVLHFNHTNLFPPLTFYDLSF